MSRISIRARLFFVYGAVVALGFGALTLVAGQQIEAAARSDYEARLLNEVRLIAEGLRPYLANGLTLDEDVTLFFGSTDLHFSVQGMPWSPPRDAAEARATQQAKRSDAPRPTLDERIAEFEDRSGGQITVLRLSDFDLSAPDRGRSPELENALRGETVVVTRRDDSGEESFFTAAPLSRVGGTGPMRLMPTQIVQLSVPQAQLQDLITQRWLSLGAVFTLVLLLTAAAALGIARSIIRPLDALRQGAAQLATGDLNHRVQPVGRDEIGAVALAFNSMAVQLQRMVEEQRAFASNTSHELRTPLTTIRLRSEALRGDPTLDSATAAQYVAEIDDEVTRLGRLIEDLTLLSRFDAGRAELGRSEIDLARLAHNLAGAMQNRAAAAGIALHVDAESDAPLIVYGSLNHLSVVFRNLLDNALKYTPSGGTVRWLLRAEPGGVRAQLIDSGQGIDPADLPRLFERFYRADKARSRQVPGTGLGLSLVQSIVAAYGGRIQVESAGRGQGTTVTLWWPTDAPSTPPAP